jgi:hypothetical protein
MHYLYGVGGNARLYLLFRFIAVGVMVYIVVKTIRMCYTKQVTWRGTNYGADMVQR